MKIRYHLAPSQQQFEPQLRELLKTFSTSGETIYCARNEIKKSIWLNLSVVIKSFGRPNLLRRYFYGRFRASKAKRSYENAIRLRDLGVETPEPIGFIEYYRGAALSESFYVCRFWPNESTVREPLQDPGFAKRLELLAELGRFAWKLHQLGIDFRDFSPGNILVNHKSDGSEALDFCLVDVNRITWGSMSFTRRMKTFAMLWAHDADLEQILDAYCVRSGDDRVRAKKLACRFSLRHKKRSARKERIKGILGL